MSLFKYSIECLSSNVSPQEIQAILDTGTFAFNGVPTACELFFGGDLPFLKGLLGISKSPAVYSVHSCGVYHPTDGWLGKDEDGTFSRRTLVSDRWYRRWFRRGDLERPLQALGVTGRPRLAIPDRRRVVPCILHCTMAIGKLLACACSS